MSRDQPAPSWFSYENLHEAVCENALKNDVPMRLNCLLNYAFEGRRIFVPNYVSDQSLNLKSFVGKMAGSKTNTVELS